MKPLPRGALLRRNHDVRHVLLHGADYHLAIRARLAITSTTIFCIPMEVLMQGYGKISERMNREKRCGDTLGIMKSGRSSL